MTGDEFLARMRETREKKELLERQKEERRVERESKKRKMLEEKEEREEIKKQKAEERRKAQEEKKKAQEEKKKAQEERKKAQEEKKKEKERQRREREEYTLRMRRDLELLDDEAAPVDPNSCYRCGRRYDEEEESNWIGCDKVGCGRWFHQECVRVTTCLTV